MSVYSRSPTPPPTSSTPDQLISVLLHNQTLAQEVTRLRSLIKELQKSDHTKVSPYVAQIKDLEKRLSELNKGQPDPFIEEQAMHIKELEAEIAYRDTEINKKDETILMMRIRITNRDDKLRQLNAELDTLRYQFKQMQTE